MSDPRQRHNSPLPGGGVADRTVKIEQLLLSGLDHYFRGRFERAIDVWTRVLFLDRNHPRARAYIDRARAAVAERLRESDGLLHAGVEACNRGDVAAARALLTTAIERGGAHDAALALLDRVERLETAGRAYSTRPARRRAGVRRTRQTAVVRAGTNERSRVLPWIVFALLGAALGGGLYAIGSRTVEPIQVVDRPDVPSGASVLRRAEPPMPSVPELALDKAATLVADDRLAEALSVLETVGLGDGLRSEVDSMRAAIQRELLARLPDSGSPSE